mmetsp:Transcript_10927/g.20586  ORF Transcript_10927/g.20586 Transcript_10927/m.20586 type:complete len:93 (+) Transcript_10927:70-348(+)
MAAVSGPCLTVPLATRPDEHLMASEEPPILIDFASSFEKSASAEKAQEADEPPKPEIAPAKQADSKIKRKATGFVKDAPPEDDERRKCCEIM